MGIVVNGVLHRRLAQGLRVVLQGTPMLPCLDGVVDMNETPADTIAGAPGATFIILGSVLSVVSGNLRYRIK